MKERNKKQMQYDLYGMSAQQPGTLGTRGTASTWGPAWLAKNAGKIEILTDGQKSGADGQLGTELGTNQGQNQGHHPEIDYWELISDEDREYIRTPPRQERCSWCKGIAHHHPLCDEMRSSWSRVWWGTYNGRNIRDVPTDYLEWLVATFANGDERRDMSELELRRRCGRDS